MKLSNTQKKLLKLLKKQKIIFIDAAEPNYSTAINYLYTHGLITKKKFVTAELENDTLNMNSFELYIMLTQSGEAEVDNLLSTKLEKLNQLLPLLAFIVSIISIIVTLITS